MAFYEAAGIDYVFGPPTNAALHADQVSVITAGACSVRYAEGQLPVLRCYAESRYGAKSWTCQRRVITNIEASTLGMDIRGGLG